MSSSGLTAFELLYYYTFTAAYSLYAAIFQEKYAWSFLPSRQHNEKVFPLYVLSVLTLNIAGDNEINTCTCLLTRENFCGLFYEGQIFCNKKCFLKFPIFLPPPAILLGMTDCQPTPILEGSDFFQ